MNVDLLSKAGEMSSQGEPVLLWLRDFLLNASKWINNIDRYLVVGVLAPTILTAMVVGILSMSGRGSDEISR